MSETRSETLAMACRILAAEGLTRVSTGHVSARTERGTVAMRGRRADDTGLQFATAADIVEVTLDGEVVGPSGVVPPRECFIHLEVLRRRPEVYSVVHAHPRWVVALRAANLRPKPIYGAYDPEGFQLTLDDIAYFPSARLVDTAEEGRQLAEVMGARRSCILDGHGIVTVGPSVEAAVSTAIALDELARITWMAAAVGPLTPISQDDQRLLTRTLSDVRTAPAGAGPKPATAGWQHWVERARTGSR